MHNVCTTHMHDLGLWLRNHSQVIAVADCDESGFQVASKA
jgi:hypothetical protein